MSTTDTPPPSRIHIIGGAGTGKTTLGRRVGSMIGVEVFDLDAIGYEGAYEGQKGTRIRTLEERLMDVHNITEKPGWVAEEGFLWWVDELFDNADVILWLDFPYRIRACRAAKREIQRTLARNNTQGGLLSQLDWLFGINGSTSSEHLGHQELLMTMALLLESGPSAIWSVTQTKYYVAAATPMWTPSSRVFSK